ncbi:MAG: D-arabinose 5-phosphate isomerase [Candidatus Cloacimonetes bacterium HGW-Cloacimonetes-3]|jgi:arabinose-5-phosphate isomerase|nr:MAG: D-arabinose 5-phosphate isomerase [Candidatus Cloacimonetes bacterium HGW-Cloacimonetes-3]
MNIVDIVISELKLEASAILKVAEQLNPTAIEHAFRLLSACKGKVVLTGIGKTGIIARKISATLASTGTTSIFLHAAEGIHGDLGMISAEDVVIAVSNSGNTQELISIIPFLKFNKVPIIALTGSLISQLAKSADVVLDCSVPPEYEPLGIVPTSSTTVALAVGDALSIALLRHKDFQLKDFARFHPGGTIGRKLLLRVCDLMHSGDELPIVASDAPMSAVIVEMTSKKLGCTAVTNSKGTLCGMITDGDLRRQLTFKGNTLLNFSATDCMTKEPKHLHPEELAVDALNLMETFNITMLPVVNSADLPVGMLHMHDLIKAGVI